MTKNKTNITPLGDRVVVSRDGREDTTTSSGIIIPDTVDQAKPEQGTVIAVGEGRTTDDGKIVPLKVKEGDTILFSKYGPDEVEVDGEEYLIISETNILAIVK
jgi:chaperonin GroES